MDTESLQTLPQRFDIWQVDARPAATTLRVGDRMARPWMLVVVSGTEGHVLAFELLHDEPSIDQALQILRKAMKEPEAGEPHRPTEVQMSKDDWTTALCPNLQTADIECVTVASLDQIGEVFEELSGQLSGQGPSGLLDMPGITPDAVGSFFDAAALFFQQAPWQKTGDRPIQVECPTFESGPWYAVVMGQGGMARGLVLYDNLKTLLRIQQGELSEQENARLTAGLVVVFGAKDDLVPADVEAAEQHRWPVAMPDAYPSIYRMEPGLSMRPPLAWELQLLEGCLRSLPEFVRKKTRRLAPLTMTVPTAAGELSLTLSWADET